MSYSCVYTYWLTKLYILWIRTVVAWRRGSLRLYHMSCSNIYLCYLWIGTVVAWRHGPLRLYHISCSNTYLSVLPLDWDCGCMAAWLLSCGDYIFVSWDLHLCMEARLHWSCFNYNLCCICLLYNYLRSRMIRTAVARRCGPPFFPFLFPFSFFFFLDLLSFSFVLLI